MTRVFWDTMLFIYLLQDDPEFGERVRHLRTRSLQRGDEICTSALAVGELLAGVYRDKSEAEAIRVRDGIVRSGVRILPFDLAASTRFGSIRARYRTSAADSIHLACAVTASVDLFLTGDEGLLKLHVDGIKFIAGINTDLF
jgi:predicted nucleic acid-binding protein